MAISFVDDWHQDHAEVSSYDVPVPVAGVAQGHTIVISTVCSTDSTDDITITDDKGNTYVPVVTLADAGNVLMVAILKGYVQTPLVNGDDIHVVLAAHLGGDFYFSEWAGLSSDSLDKTASHLTGFDNAYSSSATAATTVANELLFAAVGTRHPPLTLTPDSPWGELLNIDNDTDCMHLVADRIVAATGAYTATGTISDDVASIALLATFKAADDMASAMWVKTL